MKLAKLSILKILESQTANQWLVNYDNSELLNLTQELIAIFTNFRDKYDCKPTILILDIDPIRFIAGLLAAIALEFPVFVGNPHWQNSELEFVIQLIQPNLIVAKSLQVIVKKAQQTTNQFPQVPSNSLIGISTGGSSGKIRFAIHTASSLTASATAFANYFSTPTINSYCTLPLYHVSGLMQLWRSLITKGKLAIVSYRNLKQGIKTQVNYHSYYLSLVPTQLQFLLDYDCDWLQGFQTILLGGAPAWRSLLTAARNKQLPISLTYGMTETAAGVSYLLPQDFLAGNNSNGKILAHAQVTIITEDNQQNFDNQVGTIQIQGKSLYQGYYPDFLPRSTPFLTDDLGFLDNLGYLYLVGRNSHKIISGGENIYPQEIESAILATKLVKDVCVLGIADQKWGQAVPAIYVPINESSELASIQQQLQHRLSKYKQPKHWLSVSSLPRNFKGKLNYPQVKEIAHNLLQNS